jgi:hypothetical protein
MIPKSISSTPIGDGNRFSDKHALGLDPRDHAQNEKIGGEVFAAGFIRES